MSKAANLISNFTHRCIPYCTKRRRQELLVDGGSHACRSSRQPSQPSPTRTNSVLSPRRVMCMVECIVSSPVAAVQAVLLGWRTHVALIARCNCAHRTGMLLARPQDSCVAP